MRPCWWWTSSHGPFDQDHSAQPITAQALAQPQGVLEWFVHTNST